MNKKRIAPKLFKNNIYRFLQIFVSYLGGAVFTIMIARTLGPADFGTYVLALSFALILISIGELGISEALVRYISLNYKNIKKAKSYFIYLLKVRLIISMILAILLILFSKVLSNFYNNPKMAFPIIIAGIYLFFYSLMQSITNIFFAFENIRAIIYKDLIFQLTRLALVPLILITSAFFIISGPIVLSIIASILSLIFLVIYIYLKYPKFYKTAPERIDKKELFKFIKYLSIGSLSILFLIHTDVLILGRFVNIESVGFYKTASSLILMFASFLTLTSIVYPVLTKLKGNKIKKVFDILFYYLFMFSIPLVMGIILMGKYIIRILFGYEYLPAVIPLYGLAILIFILPLEEMFRVLINSRGKSKLTAGTMVIASILNIFLNFVFIYLFLAIFKAPIYAALGAGIATVLSRSFVFISLLRISKKNFNIRIKSRQIIKPLISSFGMLVFLIYFNRLISERANLFLVLIEVVLAIIIYFIILYLIKGISKKEINYVSGLIKESFKPKI